ncbi:hypothetical protein QN416_23055 [Glaciimonas sp. Cout2]|uniref:hypothetical protein n=1 Tax=Glaciimonas sp. Cout2 TaxID=3048621 RepID=UPI002B233BC1|nr:hypothetical protein [Glaciimonas sp. Cout2]MEB0014480.1 hypothetical protein [Glaciimonas sp. Cout2]
MLTIDAASLELQKNVVSLIVAGIGGLILYGVTIAEHWNRPPEAKLSSSRYVLWFVAMLIWLLFLAIILTAIYILNGDKMGVMLSFQVGLSSPAIVQNLLAIAANKVVKQGVVVDPIQ